MKRTVGFFIAFILSAVVYSAGAQNEQNDENALRNVVERNTYGDNWFVSLGGNANLLTAEQDGDVSALKRIKFGGAFTVGKWFNSDFGARIQLSGGALRGFQYIEWRGGPNSYYVVNNYQHNGETGTVYADLKWPMGGSIVKNPEKYKFVTGKDNKEGFWQDFNYATATVDLMGNLTNLMRGHSVQHNFIDVIPFVGLGYIRAITNHVTTPNFDFFVGKIGVRVNFNISNNWAIYLEPQGNVTGKEFDGYAGDALGDGIVNLGLGVQYTFNKRFTSLTQVAQLTADEVDRLNKKINDNRSLIENQQDILERQQNLLDKLQRCCDENKKEVVTQVVEAPAFLPEYVRFTLDSYKIDPMEQQKIVEVANYLNKAGNSNSKLLIVGYADRQTGNPRYNLKLSQNRVDAVAAELKRLGVEPNRIVSEWKGDKEQPFPQNEWNRVVIMVERK